MVSSNYYLSRISLWAFAIAVVINGLHAQESPALEPAPASTSAPVDISIELRKLPDGVLKVKTHDDGSFKSLIVKATVEIEDVLGATKGKSLAHKEAENACKRYLAKWLDEQVTFAETQNNAVTIVTKGESAKDAAGNVVKLKAQSGEETKTLTENSTSLSNAVLSGITTLQSEVTDGGEYVLIMGLSDKFLNQAQQVKQALSTSQRPANGPGSPMPGIPGNTSKNPDMPSPERKVNPDAADFL